MTLRGVPPKLSIPVTQFIALRAQNEGSMMTSSHSMPLSDLKFELEPVLGKLGWGCMHFCHR